MKTFRAFIISLLLCGASMPAWCWGFWAHRKINYCAVFLLPPGMMGFYKSNINFLTEHATDPDKRRYAVADEGPRHYIDIDKYGAWPYDSLPRRWDEAVKKFGADSLEAHGIVPWHIQVMLQRLTAAFRSRDLAKILKNSADIGHYIADAHVPLHASSNHNGQLTNQRGIHGFWESRVPELLADREFDFFIGKASYIQDPRAFIWARVLESARAADTVLSAERSLNNITRPSGKYAFEERNGVILKQYSSDYTIAYNKLLSGMVERRMRQSITAVADFWYTAWVNAGQPDLAGLTGKAISPTDSADIEKLNQNWSKGGRIIGRDED